ncbi:MAG: alpha-amylase family glycosyl hydrolase, partial [Clostridium sp.]
MKRTVLALLIVTVSMLSGCSKKAEVKENDDKYKNYYEIFVGSFYDSDEDGIGDINGIIEKLDYLNDGDNKSDKDLGINGIWLMPVMPSPTYHKYDVTDYLGIDPQYGTMEDFEKLIKECNKRGVDLIIDLVLNHTSAQNPWFISAKKSLTVEPCGKDVCAYSEPCREHNKYVKYYNFSEEKLSGYHSVGMPTGWYYEGVFWDQMPDLNLDNEEVWNEIENISKFWLDKGVAGFRLDAVTSYYTGNVSKNVDA